MNRLQQIRTVFDQTRAADPRMLPVMIAVAAVLLVVPVVVGLLLNALLFGIVAGAALAPLGAMMILGRRAQKVQFEALEGRPGAAAAIIQAMRGRWLLTPAVAVTRKQDLVHRVVGRSGVVLVGEGSPARVKSMLQQEKRRLSRVVGEGVPIHEISVGDGKDQVPLQRLRSALVKLPGKLRRKQISELDRRLAALGDSQLPMPKGPMPTSPRVGRTRRRR